MFSSSFLTAIAQQFLRVKFFFFPERRCSLSTPTLNFYPFHKHFLSRLSRISLSSLPLVRVFPNFSITKIFHIVVTFKSVQCILLFLLLHHMSHNNLENCVVFNPWRSMRGLMLCYLFKLRLMLLYCMVALIETRRSKLSSINFYIWLPNVSKCENHTNYDNELSWSETIQIVFCRVGATI